MAVSDSQEKFDLQIKKYLLYTAQLIHCYKAKKCFIPLSHGNIHIKYSRLLKISRGILKTVM